MQSIFVHYVQDILPLASVLKLLGMSISGSKAASVFAQPGLLSLEQPLPPSPEAAFQHFVAQRLR